MSFIIGISELESHKRSDDNDAGSISREKSITINIVHLNVTSSTQLYILNVLQP